jgi:hypothetical protein
LSEFSISSTGQQQSDSSGLSSFAQLLTMLQQLEQSDPSKYAQVTGDIAKNLTAAAQTAQQQGNSTLSSQLTQLASDFTKASTTGQLPDIQDLAQALGGSQPQHHHHSQAVTSDSDADAGTGSNSSTASTATGATSASTGANSAVQLLNQLLSAFQTNASQSDSLNPMNIILSTLSNAGVTPPSN